MIRHRSRMSFSPKGNLFRWMDWSADPDVCCRGHLLSAGATGGPEMGLPSSWTPSSDLHQWRLAPLFTVLIAFRRMWLRALPQRSSWCYCFRNPPHLCSLCSWQPASTSRLSTPFADRLPGFASPHIWPVCHRLESDHRLRDIHDPISSLAKSASSGGHSRSTMYMDASFPEFWHLMGFCLFFKNKKEIMKGGGGLGGHLEHPWPEGAPEVTSSTKTYTTHCYC